MVAGIDEGRDRFTVVRYNPDGSTDSSFGGGDGEAIAYFGVSFIGQVYPSSLIQQSDGKLVVAGSVGDAFGLARFNADGSMDDTFDGDGLLLTQVGVRGEGHSVIQQADGKLVVAGFSEEASGFSDAHFAVLRYNNNGTLDTTFNDTGKVTTVISSGSEVVSSVIQQADGKLVAVGTALNTGAVAMARYNANGSLDTGFDDDGVLTTSMTGYDVGIDVVQQADGKLAVSGFSSLNGKGNVELLRYNANGSLDTGFA